MVYSDLRIKSCIVMVLFPINASTRSSFILCGLEQLGAMIATIIIQDRARNINGQNEKPTVYTWTSPKIPIPLKA